MKRLLRSPAERERHAAQMRQENAGNIRKRYAAIRRWNRARAAQRTEAV